MPSPLIPREALFGNPDRASPLVSPDGKRLAWLAPDEGVLNVWVAPVDDPAAAVAVTHDRLRGIRMFAWCYDDEHLVYLQDQDGDENWHVHAVRADGSAERDLTPVDGVQARIVARSQRHPGSLLIGLNDREPQLHDIYRIDLATGERTLVLQNPGLIQFWADQDYNIVLAMTVTPDGGAMILENRDGQWTPIAQVPQEDALTVAPIAIDNSGRRFYLVDSRERDTAAAYVWDLDTGERTLLYEDAKADVNDLMVHPTERTVQAIASTWDRTRWTLLDDDIQPDLDALGELGGEVQVLSRDLADAIWTVGLLQDDGPVRYVLWRRADQTVIPLFTNRSALSDLDLSTMHPVVIPSRDGLELVSYLSLPHGDDQAGRPTKPLPLVLYVHGGPWARDSWGYNPIHQWLANRGYAVLSVNFRGSTGFGKSFVNAGNLEWGAAMHDDLLDAVNWAVEAGITQADQVAIMGGSYGGYATLAGLTFTPDVFACGVDIVGPSSLITLIESVPEYWKPLLAQMTTRVGDPSTEDGRAFLWSRSPLSKVDAIVKPLLIGQGANDPRVKQAESDQIVLAMQQREIPVTYVLFPDEGHGFARPENSIAFWAITEHFLATHLGGRTEPVGTAVAESTAEIKAGDLPR